jgi:hypothetical protein
MKGQTMTILYKSFLALVLGSGMLLANTGQMKLYDIKSGKIDYEIRGSGTIMGMTMKTVGKKRVLFDDYGARNLTEENKITRQTVNGQTKTEKSHTITYMKDGIAYNVDFTRKRIVRMGNVGAVASALMGGQGTMQQAGEAMMKQLGGKKTGTDKVLDYTCDVWEALGTKQCLYKGIPLRVETDVMGIKNVEVATKAAFDISLSDEDFKLPDFPIYDMGGKKLDKANLSQIDKREKEEAQEGMEALAEAMSAAAAAAQQAGVKPGEVPSKSQEQAMEDAMMAAMLPRAKEEMLKEVKGMRYAYDCLRKADTLKEANLCSKKASEMNGEPNEPFEDWSEQTKKETLQFLDTFLNRSVPCVEKAQTMQDMRQCLGQ